MFNKTTKISIAAAALMGTIVFNSTANANQCTDYVTVIKADISTKVDPIISRLQKQKNEGVVTIRFDLDGDGPMPQDTYNVDELLQIYRSAKATSFSTVDGEVESCEKALVEMEAEAKAVQTAAILDPGSTIVSGLIEKALSDAGLGANNDLRGALVTMINPIKPTVKIITKPKVVIKKILRKPLILITPWKW